MNENKKAKKVVALLLCAVLLVVGSVTGTMAYLTSQDTVTNTFTVGNVKITLDEAKVDEYGVATSGRTSDGNSYKLIPGHTYVKDPTIHVNTNSEPAYIRMKVTLSDDTLKDVFPSYVAADDVFLLQNFVNGWDNTIWEFKKYDAATRTYEFRYRDVVDNPVGYTEATFDITPLFTSITIPTDAKNEDLAKLTNGFGIEIVAEAIQADGFANADAAWSSF